jgi:hypothetical protein
MRRHSPARIAAFFVMAAASGYAEDDKKFLRDRRATASPKTKAIWLSDGSHSDEIHHHLLDQAGPLLKAMATGGLSPYQAEVLTSIPNSDRLLDSSSFWGLQQRGGETRLRGKVASSPGLGKQGWWAHGPVLFDRRPR